MKPYWWILLAALVARLLLALLTPLGDEPALIPYFNDEEAHFNYVRYLDRYGKLPVQTSSVKDGFMQQEYEYYQAPLYYYLCRPFYSLGSWLTPGREHYWLRLVSILFSMGGLVLLFRVVSRYFVDSNLGHLVLIAGAFGGVSLRFGSLVTNDSLLFALSCAYLGLLLYLVHKPRDNRLYIVGLMVIIAGLWTKASFIIMLPLLPALLIIDKRRFSWQAVGMFIIPLLAILPWYWRNYGLYGHLIPLDVGSGIPLPLSFGRVLDVGKYFARSLIFPYDQLWGSRLDAIIYPLGGLVFIVSVIGGFMYLYGNYKYYFGVFLATVVLNVIGFLSFCLRYFQSEARLMMALIPLLYLLLVLGAYSIFKAKKSLTFIALSLWVFSPWIGAIIGV